MWKVEIRKDRFVLLAHFPDSEHYFTFKRPLHYWTYSTIASLWQSSSSLTCNNLERGFRCFAKPILHNKPGYKNKNCVKIWDQHFLWRQGLGYIRQSPNIDIWPKFFTKYWQLTISSSGKERHLWRGGERGKVIYVTRSTLPHFHFILHTFNILLLSFTF